MNSHNCQNVFIALLADNIVSSYNSEQIEDLVCLLKLLLTNIDYCCKYKTLNEVTNKKNKT